ncbi:hypothetical protein LCGC14_1477250 [marine sediment metagenome]|uniref:Uncharacterized protein n=1 Tax=marine sediment metagenome TaxID=412755 RepID=A0A0F9LR41_9ZZZZ
MDKQNNNFRKEMIFLLTVISMAAGVVLYVASINTKVAVISNTLILEIASLKKEDQELREKNEDQDKVTQEIIETLLTKLNGK